MQGGFLWGRRANARCLAWEPQADGASVTGEHDGYTRLADPVIHRRTVNLDAALRQVSIRDEILAAASHNIEVHFHLAETCSIKQLGPNYFELDAGPGTVTLEIDSRLCVRIDRGRTEPIAGWVSRGYHRKSPAVSLTGLCTCEGNITLDCRLRIGQPTASPPTGAASDSPARRADTAPGPTESLRVKTHVIMDSTT